MRLRVAVVAALIAVGAAWRPSAQALPPGGAREAVGPFPSWTNLKTVYHAAGDGVADDTAPLQQALNDLAAEKGSPVLYIPAGTYRITKSLTLTSVMSINILGDDPATTTIVWDGEAGGMMALLNGVAYSRISRLTFDGRRTAAVAIEQRWDGTRSFFDTGNEYSDVTFADSEFGIRGGFADGGFAETSIMRAKFLRNTAAGVALGNFNALDIWVWDSLFEDCGVGVTNNPGAGNFRVYDSVFRRSQHADISIQNTGVFTARGNYSVDSKAFFVSGAALNHPANIDIHANTIVDPLDATAIKLGSQGPGAILDNIVRSRPSARGPVVSWRSFIDADMASIGNTFTVPTPTFNNGRLVSFGDRVVGRDTLTPAEPALPPTPPRVARAVVEVAPGSGAVAIQEAIDRALATRSPAPIVHLPFGRFSVDRTINIPASDLQIAGDGFKTVLEWVGPAGGTVFAVQGPSRAQFRDLMISGAQRADVVRASAVDQPGARVYLEGAQVRGGREANLSLDRLANLAVEIVNSDHADSDGASFVLKGGTTTIFAGASSNNALSYDVSGRATLLARDAWYEGRSPNGFARVSGEARATFHGSRVATRAGATAPSFDAADLRGSLAVITTHLEDQIAATGDGSRAEILALSLFREAHDTPMFENRAAPPARALTLNTRQRYPTQGRLSPGSVQVRDSGVPDTAFITRMLADTRSRLRPSPLVPGPAATTDLRFFRVWLNAGRNDLALVGTP